MSKIMSMGESISLYLDININTLYETSKNKSILVCALVYITHPLDRVFHICFFVIFDLVGIDLVLYAAD